MKRESCTEDANYSEILSESTMKFVATWKATYCHNSVDEVLGKMLRFYRIKKKKKLQALLFSDPFAGLLDIAVCICSTFSFLIMITPNEMLITKVQTKF